jgi:RNA polymerase sigma factor (sigma-70 family)
MGQDGSLTGEWEVEAMDFRQMTDAQLMEVFYQGDNAAMNELFARYRGRLVRFFRGRGLPEGTAEDGAQNVLLQVLGSREEEGKRYDPRRGDFLTWLFGTAYYEFLHALDARERDGRMVPFGGAPARSADGEAERFENNIPGDGPGPEEAFWQGWRRQAVQQCLSTLPERERKAVERWLATDGAEKLRELAVELGVPITTAHRLRQRAFEGMRNCLEDAGESG